MADMMDYLDWRGDVPFSASPFNEVDNLILSEVAYVDFEGIVPGPDEWAEAKTPQMKKAATISVTDALIRFWELHTKEEIDSSGTFYKKAPYVLEKLCSGPRFGNIYLAGYINQVSAEKDEQMSAITFFLPDGTAFAAFRGTDDSLIGWKEDFTFSFRKTTAGQKSASEYLNKMFGIHAETECREYSFDNGLNLKKNYPIRVGGHSKGGNFAVYASAFCAENVKNRIACVYNNDGPGVLEETARTKEYKEILPKVYSIIPQESLFGLLLHSGYCHKVIKSSAKGLFQHDALTWQVKRSRFEEVAHVSEKSLMLEKAIESWVYGMTLEEREKTVNILFTLFEETGFENISEFGSEQFRGIPELLRAYGEMSAEEQHMLREVIKRMFKSGASSLSEELQEKLAAYRKGIW